jgi:hypothetical protein
MKTFDDLEFKPHHLPNHFSGHAVFEFDNGYKISVVKGEFASSTDEEPYEVLIYNGGEMVEGGYNPIGYCTEEKVTLIMEFLESINILHMLERKLNKGEMK